VQDSSVRQSASYRASPLASSGLGKQERKRLPSEHPESFMRKVAM